jgi:hypothetical protein
VVSGRPVREFLQHSLALWRPLNEDSVKTDLNLRFNKGAEFTKRNRADVHCIIHSFVPEAQAYLVEFTATGNIKKLSEKTLIDRYFPSSRLASGDALKASGSIGGLDAAAHEDGETWSP